MQDAITFSIVGAVVFVVVFVGLAVLGAYSKLVLSHAGRTLGDRIGIGPTGFFAAGLVLALVTVIVYYTVSWEPAVILGIVAVAITTMGEGWNVGAC